MRRVVQALTLSYSAILVDKFQHQVEYAAPFGNRFGGQRYRIMSSETRKVDGCARETEALHPELAAREAQIGAMFCQLTQNRRDKGCLIRRVRAALSRVSRSRSTSKVGRTRRARLSGPRALPAAIEDDERKNR